MKTRNPLLSTPARARKRGIGHCGALWKGRARTPRGYRIRMAINAQNPPMQYIEHAQARKSPPSGPDTAWVLRLARAVEAEDQAAIWRLMNQHLGNETAQQLLADEVSRVTTVTASGTELTELYLVPVVAPGNSGVIGSAEAWTYANATLQPLISEWFGAGHRIKLLDRIFPMEWIAAWDPADLRRVLALATRALSGPLPVTSHSPIPLPHAAPRLGFIAMTVSAAGRWPCAPPESRNDVRFADIARHTLCMASESTGLTPAHLPAVLTPDRMQYAFTDGVCLWARMLHERVGIVGWHIQPTTVKQDSVNILLHLADELMPVTYIALRLHQIGAAGFQDIVAQLWMCAPNLEQIQF